MYIVEVWLRSNINKESFVFYVLKKVIRDFKVNLDFWVFLKIRIKVMLKI